MGRPPLHFTYILPPTAEKMRFPVSFTLVFLCLSMANALESFAQQEDFDKIDPVARPSNLTLLTGTGGVGIVPQGCVGCPKVCPPLLPCNKTLRVKMCCAPTFVRGKPTCRNVGECYPLN